MTSFSAFDILSLQKIGCTSTIQVNLIVFGLHYLCSRSAASAPSASPFAFLFTLKETGRDGMHRRNKPLVSGRGRQTYTRKQ